MFRSSRFFNNGHSIRMGLTCICLAAIMTASVACNLPFNNTEDTEDETETASVDSTTIETAPFVETSAATEPTTVVETETVATTTEPSISNPANMYTSYAHMESFDTTTGWATFDYFDILRGQDAIDWLVAHEGYTIADATTLVNDFADSEFVYKNINPQLRTADMQDVVILMMYLSDGTPMPGAEPTPLTYSEFVTLYTGHPAYVMDSFFYRVIVSGGVITEVHQVYWP